MEKYGLAFSGGKDSMACLFLLKDRGLLDNCYVIWVNTGKNYPELLKTMDFAKSMCKNFIEIKTDRDEQNMRCGIPSEIIPVKFMRVGMQFSGDKKIAIQSFLACCYENISWPLNAKVKELGITRLVRGQRNDESFKSPARDGSVFEGITYVQPIETWTSEMVMDYLKTKMDIPDHYSLKHSSMDCYDCTAFLSDSKDRIAYTKERHPQFYAEYSARIEDIKSALKESFEDLHA